MNDETSKPARGVRWGRIVLFLSLTLNILIVGVVAGAVLGRDGERPADRLRGARDLAPPPFVFAIEKEDRRTLLRGLKDRTSEGRRDRETVRAELQAILAALRAENFDARSISDLLNAERDRSQTRQAMGERVYIEYLESLTLAERRAYADRLEGVLKRISRK